MKTKLIAGPYIYINHQTWYLKVFCLIAFLLHFCLHAQDHHDIRWDSLPPIPVKDGALEIQGLAGHFAGIHHDVLIVAGGTSFHGGGRPWNGDQRIWNGGIYVLESDNSGTYKWLDTVFDMPFSKAYGASVSIPEGVLCIGGIDSASYYTEVFLLSWNTTKRVIEINDFPDLPTPMAYMGATVMDGYVYIAGGETGDQPGVATKAFYRLDLNKKGQSNFKWERLKPWPGPGRMMPVVAAQNNGKYNNLFLFSGRRGVKEAEEILFDSYVYDPKNGDWEQRANVQLEGGPERCLSGASSVAIGSNHILVFSGADSESHRRFRSEQEQYRQAKTSVQQDSLRAILNSITDTHTGFSREVLAYHTLTDKWVKVGEFPYAAPVATHAVWWQGDIVIPSGEIAPALRSPVVWKAYLRGEESSVLRGGSWGEW